MSDMIWLSGIRAHANHGVFDFERETGQEFVLDVGYELDTRRAAAGDDLSRTVSYADVASALHDALTSEPVSLLETLAERLARVVLSFAGIVAVTVVVHKPEAPMAVPFSDVTLTIRRTPGSVVPEHPEPCVLALGGNIGDVPRTLTAAVAEIGERLSDVVVGPLVRTSAMIVPGSPPQEDYWNTVVVGRTSLAATELLDLCQRVEREHGRVRHERWGARTIDVDIVSYGALDLKTERLTLPHPGAGQRAFVLVPWADADPTAGLRGARVAELAEPLRGEILEYRALWIESGTGAPW